LDYAPSDEVSDFLLQHKNFFPELEEAAVRIRRTFKNLGRRVISDQIIHVLEKQFRYKVTLTPPATGGSSIVRKIDREARTITIPTALTEQALKSQLAATAGLLTLDESKLHERLVADARPRHAETARLIKIHLANYFAGALLLPYDDYFTEVQRT